MTLKNAGFATGLSHEITDNKNVDNNNSVMKHILTMESKQCTDYQAAL